MTESSVLSLICSSMDGSTEVNVVVHLEFLGKHNMAFETFSLGQNLQNEHSKYGELLELLDNNISAASTFATARTTRIAPKINAATQLPVSIPPSHSNQLCSTTMFKSSGRVLFGGLLTVLRSRLLPMR